MTAPGVAYRCPAVETGEDAPAPGECHIWLVPIRRRVDWLDLLDDDERRHARRLTVRHVRDTFVTSRAAQRLIGSRYLGLPTRQVSVSRVCRYCGALHGRPVFDAGTLDYSVSHAGNWVLVAVVGAGLVGADIECVESDRDIDALAGVALTAGELEHAARMPPAERAAAFFIAWTRKEATMKLTGLGLQAPPNQLDVSGSRVIVDRVPRWPDVPVHLHGAAAPTGYQLALATTMPLTAVHRHIRTSDI